MRNLSFILIIIITFRHTYAQERNSISVKLMITDKSNYANATFNIIASVFAKNADTIYKYKELHHIKTSNGFATLKIGNGTILYGQFDTIQFDKLTHSIKFEIDWLNSGNYEHLNSLNINAVPYALFAKTLATKGITGPKGDTGLYIRHIYRLNDTIVLYFSDGQSVNYHRIKGADGADGESVLLVSYSQDTLFLQTNQQFYKYSKLTGEQGPTGPPAPLGKYKHYVGERYGGGIVFYVYHDSSGEHGLIVSEINLSEATIWSNYSLSFMPDSCQTSWDGHKATDCIISQVGHAISAALICDTSTHNGLTDWYLPSIGEFYLLIKNYFEVETALKNFGLTPLNLEDMSVSYWTSTELTRERAVRQNMFNLGQNSFKSVAMKVRAIRRY